MSVCHTNIVSQSRALDADRYTMTNIEKALLICFIGLIFSMTLIAIDAYRLGKERGIREGWHRGRALSRQEFWEE